MDKQEFSTGAQRDTQEGKWRLDLIDSDFELAVAKVMEKGAKPPPEGYGEDNWRKGMPYSRLYASMRRHLMAWWLGMDGEDHLAHLACNVMFAIAYRDRVKDGHLPSELDDRPNEKSRVANLTSTKKPATIRSHGYKITQGMNSVLVLCDLCHPKEDGNEKC